MNHIYDWRPGSRISGDAQKIGDELERIARMTGDLTPERVVEAAKARRSPLNPIIYDGTTPDEALTKYRLQRASQLLKVIVIREEAQGEPIVVPAFFRIVKENGTRSWETMADTRLDSEWSEQVVSSFVRRMRSLKNDLDAYEMFPNVSLALEEALAA